MDVFLGLIGLVALVAFIVGIVFLFIKKLRKIGTWMAPLGFVLAIICFISAGSMSSGSDSTQASTAPSSSESSTSSSTPSKDSGTSDKSSTKPTIDKEAKVNFTNTIGQQTTKVTSASIKDISDVGATDDNGNNVQYALLIKMSVTNKAPDTAQTYPSQGHVVLPNGTQLNAIGAADMQFTDAFKDGDVANGATVSGYVIFPLTSSQAKDFKNGNFKFEVLCGDSNMVDKNYDVAIKF